MSVSSLSSLSDARDVEEVLVAGVAHQPRVFRRPRRFRTRRDPFDIYDDEEFKSRFRINKITFNELYLLIGVQLQPLTQRNQSISARLQILITLRFLATGSFQLVLADNIGIHKSSVSRIVLPNGSTATSFHNIRGFPKVIGAIDCTHIKIRSLGGEDAERFRNRKGYFSINIQVVCDAKLKVRNIVARWPGSVHDATIFNDSPLCADLTAGNFETDYILGDNGYPSEATYLLTPLLNPVKHSERAYNAAHRSTRNCVERCFGVLKRRFPCLSKGLDIKLQTTLHVIIACAVLHNICILKNDEFNQNDLREDVYEEEPELQIANNIENTAVRTALITTVFAIN